MQTIYGPYRQLRAHTDKGPLHDIQTRPQGVPTDKEPCRHCAISTDKVPLHDIQERDPTNMDPLQNKGLLQMLCNSYRKGAPTKKGPLHYIQARGPTGKGLHTSKEHNISITALPDFKKIINFFNISHF